jgi:hypothetical protein
MLQVLKFGFVLLKTIEIRGDWVNLFYIMIKLYFPKVYHSLPIRLIYYHQHDHKQMS